MTNNKLNVENVTSNIHATIMFLILLFVCLPGKKKKLKICYHELAFQTESLVFTLIMPWVFLALKAKTTHGLVGVLMTYARELSLHFWSFLVDWFFTYLTVKEVKYEFS